MFRPKLLDTLVNYGRSQFGKDVIAGAVVGIVALPLAIAFAIASGVSPEKGLITAIVGGLIISVFGGSRVQIGGPTGAFIVIVYGIIQTHGIDGLIIATFIAGIMLILMGVAGLGNIIKYIPYPLIVGFTSGIAVIIFSSQIKDFLGLPIPTVPADFLSQWQIYFRNILNINWYAVAIGLGTVVIGIGMRRITSVVPGTLIAIVFWVVVSQVMSLPVETIGSRFGHISSTFPLPSFPNFSWPIIQESIQPAFTIALLGAIESLLSALVADGMIGGNHRSNTELIAQGGANMVSSLFGGIPATGAIARTATNVKNGGRTPVAGIVHSLTLLMVMLLAGNWAGLIPMSCLAGVLVLVAFNMSEHHTFINILKGSRSDAAVLIIAFLLTVFVDLTVAIEIGMVLAVFLFMRSMIQLSNVTYLLNENESVTSETIGSALNVSKDVEVFEITGPFFFGAAYKFKDAIKMFKKKPKVLIVKMSQVPIIDATGVQILKDVLSQCNRDKIQLILTGIQPKVYDALKKSRLLFKIGKRYVTDDWEVAVQRSEEVLRRSVVVSRDSQDPV